MPLTDNVKGSLYMASAMASFAINDAIVKSLTTSLNVGQIMLTRGLLISTMVFALAWHFQALRPLRQMLSPLLIVRALCEIGAAITFMWALGSIPLANASAIMQSLPLAVTLGAALFLGEPVGWRRWLAIIVGFIGVMIIVRPGPEGFHLPALGCVASLFFAATRDLITRRIDPSIPSLSLTTVSAIAVTLAGALLVQPLGGWHPLDLSIYLRLGLSGLVLIVGYQSIVLAMRTGEVSAVAPFRYTQLIWALILAFFIFGEVPDSAMFAGAAIVIGSGLYTFYREKKRRAQPLAQKATTPH